MFDLSKCICFLFSYSDSWVHLSIRISWKVISYYFYESIMEFL